MADPTPQDRILPLQALKQALGIAETKPLACALGLTKDKKDCLLLVDKNLKPKPVAAKLKAAGAGLLDEKTLRFGFVHMDKEKDPGTLHFTINKSEVGGTIMTLVKLAKKAGYPGIVINPDEALENAPEHDSQEGETQQASPKPELHAEAPSAPPQQPPREPPIDVAALKARLTELVKQMIARTAVDPSHKDEMMSLAKQAQALLATGSPKLATEKADALEAMLREPPLAPPGSNALDAKALKARLTALVKEMLTRVATDPSNKDTMTELAKEGQSLLGANDLAGAAQKADALEELLRNAGEPKPNGEGRPEGDFVRMQKARLLWESARKKAEAEIEKFKAAVEADFIGDEDEDAILDRLDELDEIPENLDERLTDTLDDLLDERTTANERTQLLKDAQGLIAEYEAFANSNPLFKKLDGATPFGVTFSVASTITQALKVLHATLH